MQRLIPLLAVLLVLQCCSSDKTNFGFTTADVNKLEVNEVRNNGERSRCEVPGDGGKILLEQICHAHREPLLLKVEYKYEVRVTLNDGNQVLLKASDHTIALQNSSEFFVFDSTFPLKKLLEQKQ